MANFTVEAWQQDATINSSSYTKILDTNTNRRAMAIENQTGVILYVSTGATGMTASDATSFELADTEKVVWDVLAIHTGEVHVKSASGSNLTVKFMEA